MSELEARKYTSIRNLREEIRQDMRDYQLLCSDDNNGNYYFPLINELSDHDVIGFSFTLESKYCSISSAVIFLALSLFLYSFKNMRI